MAGGQQVQSFVGDGLTAVGDTWLGGDGRARILENCVGALEWRLSSINLRTRELE